MLITVVTPPASEPISYADAKAQCRLDSDAEQSLFQNIYIPAARATAEKAIGKSLITRTLEAEIYWEDTGHGLSRNREGITLPRGPVQSIVSVVDKNNLSIPSANYEYRRHGTTDSIRFLVQVAFPVTVEYVAGYGSFDEYGTVTGVPDDIRSAMLAHIQHLWMNRGATIAPSILDGIYRQYRSFAG